MRLTTYTDYSLRVLMYLGLVRDRLATIDEISGAYGISANHLMKIIHHLGKLRYVETVRGRSGGLRLASRPEEISLGKVVRQMERDFAVVECLDAEHRDRCLITPACALALIFEEAAEAFLNILDRRTLADLLRNETRLKPLLGIGNSSAPLPPRGSKEGRRRRQAASREYRSEK